MQLKYYLSALSRQIHGTALLVFFVIASMPPSQLFAQATGSEKQTDLTAPAIVAKMTAMNGQRAAALKAFNSQRTYDLDYSGFPSHKHAKMIVDGRFKAPTNKELKVVSEEGSELLRTRVLHKLIEAELEASERGNRSATELTEANYSFSLAGREQKDGRDCFVLQVEPRIKSKFLYDGKIWVDSQDFAVVHILAQPAKNPSFWIKHVDIEHRYQKVGSFWLPLQNTSTSTTRLGGRATLTIEYGSYDVDPKSGGVQVSKRLALESKDRADQLAFGDSGNWSDIGSKR